MDLIQAPEALERERDAATWTAWGGALPLDGYLALVNRLRNHPWPREAMTTWVLRDAARAALASCQAYRMPSRHHGSPGHAYVLGSVFVDPLQRGRGLASLLLDRLAGQLRASDPSAQACVLFAEAGASAYRRAGFQDRRITSLAFPARMGDPAATVDALIQAVELPAVASALHGPEIPFALHPSPAQLDWHLERERILLGVTGGTPPPLHGARAGRGLALWMADPIRDSLIFLCFRPQEPAEASALLEAARRTAAACGLPQVLLWDATEAPDPIRALGALQEGSLHPMLLPLAAGLQAADWSPISGAARI